MSVTLADQPRTLSHARGPVLRVADPAADLLSPSMRRQLRRAEARLAREGLTAAEHIYAGAWAALLEPVIEAAHRARDAAAGRPCDLDQPAQLAAWQHAWRAAARAGTLELTVLTAGPPGQLGVMAAYLVAERDEAAGIYRVADSRMVTAWRRFSAGRLLEARVIRRVQGDPAFTLLDWGSHQHAEALIAVSS